MSLRLVTPHDEEDPVVVFSDFLLHAGLQSDIRDSDTQGKLDAAITNMESATGRAFLESTWAWSIDRFPCDRCILLPKFQVQSVTSIIYTDSANVPHTFDSTKYRLVGGYDKVTSPKQLTYGAKIYLKYGEQWPTETLQWGEPIKITFVCGWDEAASVPLPLKQAIVLEAAHLYRNRESVTIERTQVQSAPLARGVDSLISPYVDLRFS